MSTISLARTLAIGECLRACSGGLPFLEQTPAVAAGSVAPRIVDAVCWRHFQAMCGLAGMDGRPFVQQPVLIAVENDKTPQARAFTMDLQFVSMDLSVSVCRVRQ